MHEGAAEVPVGDREPQAATPAAGDFIQHPKDRGSYQVNESNYYASTKKTNQCVRSRLQDLKEVIYRYLSCPDNDMQPLVIFTKEIEMGAKIIKKNIRLRITQTIIDC